MFERRHMWIVRWHKLHVSVQSRIRRLKLSKKYKLKRPINTKNRFYLILMIYKMCIKICLRIRATACRALIRANAASLIRGSNATVCRAFMAPIVKPIFVGVLHLRARMVALVLRFLKIIATSVLVTMRLKSNSRLFLYIRKCLLQCLKVYANTFFKFSN
jgi:hypothetical protein